MDKKYLDKDKVTNKNKCWDTCYGEKLMLASTAISMQLGSQCSADELDILAALFTIVGDQLALLSITHAENESRCNGENSNEQEEPILIEPII